MSEKQDPSVEADTTCFYRVVTVDTVGWCVYCPEVKYGYYPFYGFDGYIPVSRVDSIKPEIKTNIEYVRR